MKTNMALAQVLVGWPWPASPCAGPPEAVWAGLFLGLVVLSIGGLTLSQHLEPAWTWELTSYLRPSPRERKPRAIPTVWVLSERPDYF